MFQQISILCLLIFGTVNMSVSKNTLMRVINGEDVTEEEFPYVVVLLRMSPYSMFRLCTGSMLTEDWGLSAGHCRPGFAPGYSTYAWYGNFTQSPMYSKKYTTVVEWNVHPTYRLLNSENHPDLLVDNDISLFRIETKLRVTKYGRLSALDRGTLLGLPVTYIGGGTTKINISYYEFFQRPLKRGEGAVIPCDVDTKIKSKHILCINPKCVLKLQYAWYGDSGGPLLHEEQIVGVGSFVVKSGDVRQTVFVPISPYIDWISLVIHSKIGIEKVQDKKTT